MARKQRKTREGTSQKLSERVLTVFRRPGRITAGRRGRTRKVTFLQTLDPVLAAFRVPALRRKLLITFLILVVYRLAAHVPLPNINRDVLQQIAQENQLLNLLDMLSGGAMTNFSVMMLGVSPYITASIIFQLLKPIIPALEKLGQEKDGREKLDRYQYLLTVPLALLQAYGQVSVLQVQYGVIAPQNFGFTAEALLPTISTLFTLVAGTMFAIWLGELINDHGVSNGLSIIILGGIVANIPNRLAALWGQWVELMTFVAVTVVTIVVIVYVQEGERGVKVTYPSKVVSGGRAPRRVKIPDRFLSLRVNSAGMIPLIFAQSILMFPGVIASYLLNVETEWVSNVATTVYSVFDGGSPYYWLMYFVMVILFTYFYTDIMFQQQDIGETIQKQGGQVGGRRPGSRTSSDLSSIVRAITLAGAVFLGLVAVLPWLVSLLLGLFGAAGVNYSSRMIVSSSGLLIAVGVILDTFRLVAGDLKSRGDQYKKMVKRSGIIRS